MQSPAEASLLSKLSPQAGCEGCAGTAGAAQPGKGYLELALDPEINRTGDVWHVCLQGLRDVGTLCYGWRAESTLGSDFVPGDHPTSGGIWDL